MTPDPTDAGVLAPEELRLEGDPVDRLDDNRYLVRPEEPAGSDELEAVPAELKAHLNALADGDDPATRSPSRPDTREGTADTAGEMATDTVGGTAADTAGEPAAGATGATAAGTTAARATGPDAAVPPDGTAAPDAGEPAADAPPTERSVAESLASAPEPHGVSITAKTDGEVASHRVTSHDVRDVFVELLTWYADQLDEDVPPEQALRIMLATSELEV